MPIAVPQEILDALTDVEMPRLPEGPAAGDFEAVAGLATCPVTHITEIPSARGVVASMLPRPGVPQALIRVGRTPELEEDPPMTPRRDIADILR